VALISFRGELRVELANEAKGGHALVKFTIPNDFLFARPDRVLKHRHEDSGRADLYVLTMVYNPWRFRRRWTYYQDFAKRVKESGAILCVAEVAQHRRNFVLGQDDPVNPDILLQLETDSEIWIKECVLNLLTKRLPLQAQYLAFMDCDFRLARDDWANECVQLLQHYDVLQMWSHMVDLDAFNEPVGQINSFIWNWMNGKIKNSFDYYAYGKPGYPGAPGLAWAWRRKALDAVGGLIDTGIIGAGDSYMAYALIGRLGEQHTLRTLLAPAYKNPMFEWQKRAEYHIKRNVGVMRGLALHFFHGPKALRFYGSREKILADCQFDPAKDLTRDAQGVYQLERSSRNYRYLRDKIRSYLTQRDEDATSSR
jgi:hypothetical protein